jgi:hypothetical protein
VLEVISAERGRTHEPGPARSDWEGWAAREGEETNFPQMSNGLGASAFPSSGRGGTGFTMTDHRRWTRRSTGHTMTSETFFKSNKLDDKYFLHQPG